MTNVIISEYEYNNKWRNDNLLDIKECQIEFFKYIVSSHNCKIGNSSIATFHTHLVLNKVILELSANNECAFIRIRAINDCQFIVYGDIYAAEKYCRTFFLLDDPYQILDVVDELNITYSKCL